MGAFHDAAPPESSSRADKPPTGPGGSQLALPWRCDLEVSPFVVVVVVVIVVAVVVVVAAAIVATSTSVLLGADNDIFDAVTGADVDVFDTVGYKGCL